MSTKNISPIAFWLVVVLLSGNEFRQNQWECLLVMFAALELAPLGFRSLGLPQKDWYALAPMGLCAAYLLDGFWFLALPYLGWTLWLTLQTAGEMIQQKKFQLLDFVRVFALGYLATGASFAVLYLAGISPLGFDPVIVSLTAAHFHVAGFVLTVLIYRLNLEMDNSAVAKAMAWAALLGMPLVAAGITLSKMGYHPLLEQSAALGFVVLALVFVYVQIRLSFQSKYPKTARRMWLAGAICLLAGGTLAALYALRFQYPMHWVNIPNLKIWHGTLNAVGFGWLSLKAWSLRDAAGHVD